MSYLEPPFGGQTPSDDWSSRPGVGGRDERSWARHDGAVPDPYADDRPSVGAPGGIEVPPPTFDLSAEVTTDPYAAYRRTVPGVESPPVPGGDTAQVPIVEPVAGDDPAPVFPDGAVAYPFRPGPVEEPAWAADTAATSTSQAEFDLAAGPPTVGRRRAGRTGSTAVAPAQSGRAGRNLRAAIVVGCSLGALIVASLYIWPPAFHAVIAAATGVGIWEMARALRTSGARAPLVPLLAGGVLMVGLAGYAELDGLTLGLVVTVAAAVVWRLGDGLTGLRRDLTAIMLVAVYVPFLLSFAILLVEQPDGADRVVATVLAVVLSDTGGYIAGVFLGKHPMAPTISPKKSWEGFGGSVLAAGLGSGLVLWLMLDVAFAWGVMFGVAIAVVAVLGDLTESMMKRDLRIKDMSQLLPGHGGLMDRLDSILFAVPTAYLLLTLIAPPG